MNNICMLWHSKIVMFWLNIIEYFFFLSYMPMHDMLKRKKYVKKNQKQNDQKCFWIWLQACILRDVGVIGCTLKVIVSIKQLWLCVSQSDFLISQIVITCIHLCNLAMFFTHNMQYSFATLDTCAGTVWFGHHKLYMC